eukprot:307691-Pleurochrysis_carterae.AAC.1
MHTNGKRMREEVSYDDEDATRDAEMDDDSYSGLQKPSGRDEDARERWRLERWMSAPRSNYVRDASSSSSFM